MTRIAVGLASLLLIVLFLTVGGSSGFSLTSTNGNTQVYGGTSWWNLAISLTLVLLFWLIHDEEMSPASTLPANGWQRAVASFLDVTATFFAAFGLLGILPALVEWLWTGTFQMYFQRAFARWTDAIVFAVVFGGAFGLVVFYVRDSLRGKGHTIGTYVADLAIMPSSADAVSLKRIMLRVLLVFAAVAIFPATLIIGRDRQGQYWHDRISEFKVMRTGKQTRSGAA